MKLDRTDNSSKFVRFIVSINLGAGLDTYNVCVPPAPCPYTIDQPAEPMLCYEDRTEHLWFLWNGYGRISFMATICAIQPSHLLNHKQPVRYCIKPIHVSVFGDLERLLYSTT